MKKIIISVFSALAFSLPVFSQSFDLNSLRADGLPAAEAPSVAVAPSASAPAVKEWTVMYYFTTKDALKRGAAMQLWELAKAGATDKVNVVVEGTLPVERADGSVSTPTVRMVLGPAFSQELLDQLDNSAFTPKPAQDVRESFLESFAPYTVSRETHVDTGDWKRASAFVKWAKANYPARHYAFIIYGHGAGFHDPKKTTRNTLMDIETHNYVTVPETRLMMEDAGKVDMLVMQSCLMQMAEIVWQVKDQADVVVGSSEMLWSIGYDLGGMVDLLSDNPGIPAADLGSWLSKSYVARAVMIKKSGHSSAIVTARLGEFASKLDSWADAVMALKDRSLLYPAIQGVARFDINGLTVNDASTGAVAGAGYYSYAGDLYDFVRLTGETLPAGTAGADEVRARGAELMSYISGSLVYGYSFQGTSFPGSDYAKAHGLSVHLPARYSLGLRSRALETNYWDIPFARETRWGDLLHWLYNHNMAAH